MNEFEKDPQEKTNDIPHAATGFIVPFVFFSLIFAIGSAISFIHSQTTSCKRLPSYRQPFYFAKRNVLKKPFSPLNRYCTSPCSSFRYTSNHSSLSDSITSSFGCVYILSLTTEITAISSNGLTN